MTFFPLTVSQISYFVRIFRKGFRKIVRNLEKTLTPPPNLFNKMSEFFSNFSLKDTFCIQKIKKMTFLKSF